MRVLSEPRERDSLSWEMWFMCAGVMYLAVVGAVVVIAWLAAQI